MYSPYFPKITEPEDVLRFIDEDSAEVLKAIPSRGYCERIKHVSIDTRIHIEIVRMIIIELKKLGLIELQTLFREDENYICGSSYYKTPLGIKVADLLIQGKPI